MSARSIPVLSTKEANWVMHWPLLMVIVYNPDLIVTVIVGDGEAETGATAT